ncbi:MAG: hypothetical protein R3343_05255 [Nitriliruptorales bacterium]|nr:hypothetical protein [Nitriliruptorales bacterium]
MDATALVIAEFESDAREYKRQLEQAGFTAVVPSMGEDPLRAYLDTRPELVVIDLLSEDTECSLLGSIRVGGWRNVHVPVVVVGEHNDRYLAAGASTVVRHDEAEESIPLVAVALYAERCRQLLERAREERAAPSPLRQPA